MNIQQLLPHQAARSQQSDTTIPRLQGSVLLLARGVWIAVVIAALIIFAASMLMYFTALHTIVHTGVTGASQDLLTPSSARELYTLGISVDFYATYLVVSKAIFVVIWCIVGGLIFWYTSGERVAFFASLTLVLFSIGFAEDLVLPILPSSWWLPVQCIRFLSGTGLAFFFYIFPDGRFVPRWMFWLLPLWIFYECTDTFFSSSQNLSDSQGPYVVLYTLLFFVLLASLVAAQIYRYRRVSNHTRRQQTKWVVSGMAAAIIGFAATLFTGLQLLPTILVGSLGNMISNTLLDLFLLFIPLSIGIAILRSRLWDIDIIINRALVYSILTAALALSYAGSVFALQLLLRSFTGANNFALVSSTLLIAVLFQPLRHRIQAIIDRRFYRSKYNTARTLEAFSATLRSEVNLDQLHEQLLAVIENTMQPEHISLWLCKVTPENKPGMHE
ncbi:MAG: hypothetical protein J2P37_21775 [Ktedonobacteraceae bacterium]|nr:hypothetical protein [Ktedonobacteraceae bacterium]